MSPMTDQNQTATCPGNDPACPCQDGDACHYRDIPELKIECDYLPLDEIQTSIASFDMGDICLLRIAIHNDSHNVRASVYLGATKAKALAEAVLEAVEVINDAAE